MHRLVIRLAFTLVAFTGAAIAQSGESGTPPARPDTPEPERFRFSVAIDAPKPLDAMLTEGLDLVRWAAEARVTAPLLERIVAEARNATRDAVAAEGYFAAQVETDIQRGDPAQVTIRVDPGPRTAVTDVTLVFHGSAAVSPEGQVQIARVRQTWLLKRGMPFRQSDWDAAKKRALAELASGAYAAARIAVSTARIDPGASAATLEVQFDSGPEYWYSATDQIIVTRNRQVLENPLIDDVAEPIEARADLPVFTDSHHNLLKILK